MNVLKSIGAALALGLAAPAGAATLDFSGSACGGACSNNALIDQGYGDIAGQVDVVWDGDADSPGNQNGIYYATGYETLVGVAYTMAHKSLSILFDTLPGFGVRVTGFDIASYGDRFRTTSVTVTDAGTSAELFATGDFVPERDCGATDVCSFSGSWGSANGVLLTFGPDAFNTGIDNIAFETYALATGFSITRFGAPPPAPVPLPASGLLLAAGLLGLSRLRSRKA